VSLTEADCWDSGVLWYFSLTFATRWLCFF